MTNTSLRCAILDLILQNRGVHEDDTRRASSYHSYSQSPPYDYQYEDRRYGKQAAALTRKPGSDRGHYEGKMSSFVYSPGRLSEQMYEDRFANDSSISRVSDYSVSSGGDPFRSGPQSPSFRSGTQSPNYLKDAGFSSPPFQSSRNVSTEDVRRQATDAFPQVFCIGQLEAIIQLEKAVLHSFKMCEKDFYY